MKVITLFGCMALLLGACTLTSKEYKLTGTFEGLTEGYVLIGHGDNSVMTADTVRIAADGTFAYTRRMEKPEMGFLYVPDKAFYSLIMLNGTETQLNANPDVLEAYSFTGDLEEAYQFHATAMQTLITRCNAFYPSFQTMRTSITALSDSIENALSHLSPKDFSSLMMEEVNMTTESVLIDYAGRLRADGKAVDCDADYNQYMEGLDVNKGNLALAYIRWKEEGLNQNNPPSYLRMLTTAEEKVTNHDVLEKTVMDLMANYFNQCDSDLEAIYQKALPLVKDEKRREWMTQTYEANKNLIPGADAIDCTLETPDGASISLSDLYGKVLYLDIWATWCGPCCAEIPYMEKLAEHFKGDNRFVPISISVDHDKEAWAKKLKADAPQWKQFLCQDITNLYGITGIPCFILIDKNGKIITTKAPRPSEPECIEFIEKLLK